MQLMGFSANHVGGRPGVDVAVTGSTGEVYGLEVKAIDKGGCVRLSGAHDVCSSVEKRIFRPYRELVSASFPGAYDLFCIGVLCHSTIEKLSPNSSGIFDIFFKEAARIVTVKETGWTSYDLTSFDRCFRIYQIDRYVLKAKIDKRFQWLEQDHKRDPEVALD